MRIMIRLLALILFCAACAAQADTRLVYEGANGDYVVSIRPGEIRIDDTGAAWQLYREQGNTIFAVNPETQSYTRMDEDVAATLRQRMDALRAKIEAEIQKLPPERRDIARAVLAEQIPGYSGKPQQVSLDRTGTMDQVAGIECEVVQVVRNGQPAERMCVASAEALGLSEAGFQTVTAMFGLMHKMLAGTGFEAMGMPYVNLNGMPIRFHDPAGGASRTLTAVSHKKLDDALFGIPNTFIEQVPGKP